MKIKLGSLKVESFVTTLPHQQAVAAEGGVFNQDPFMTMDLCDSGGASNDDPNRCSHNADCTYMTGCGLNTCGLTCGRYPTLCMCD